MFGKLGKLNFTKKKNKPNDIIHKNMTNSEKLNIIIGEIVGIKGEIAVIKKDIVNIKTDLADFRQEFNKYKKQDSDFQEARINNFIISLLSRNKNTYNINLIPIENIYMPYSNSPLSEFDGLILYTPNQSKMPHVSQELIERVDSDFHTKLKDNISQINTVFTLPQLIVVESKRSVSKQKIDTKIMQMYEFIHMLKTIKTIDMSATKEVFRDFLGDLIEYSRLTLNELQNIDIKVIFGSDDITLNMHEYICAIHDGITEDKYNELCSRMFYDDKYATKFIRELSLLDTVSKPVKSLLKHYRTFDELKNIIETHFKEHNMGHVASYFTSYNDMKQYFELMVKSIGIVQFNKATFPELFQFSSMNAI
jgi:hypothetical protein